MIDKTTEKWKKAPFWVRHGLWGIKERKVAKTFEIFSFTVGFISSVVSFVYPPSIYGAFLLGAAYWYAISIRWVDNECSW